jgi:hypothetical protein
LGKKEAYQEKTEAQLQELDAQIQLLRAQADKAEADVKLEYNKQLASLTTKQEIAREKLQALQAATEETWEDLRAAEEDALDDLRDAVAKTVSGFAHLVGQEQASVAGMREAYQEKTEAHLKELGAQIELMEAKAAIAKPEIKIEYQRQIDALRAKEGAVQGKLDEFRQSGEAAWEELKAGVDTAVSELQEAVGKAASEFE